MARYASAPVPSGPEYRDGRLVEGVPIFLLGGLCVYYIDTWNIGVLRTSASARVRSLKAEASSH